MGRQEFVDMHTHVLPGMDDGAASIEESARMMARMAEQGVYKICLTPHYFHYEEPLEAFCDRRSQSFQGIAGYAAELDIAFILGSETFLTPDLLNEPDLDSLCIGDTRCLLLETRFDSTFSSKTTRLIECIMSNFNVTPVLAHIDRYPPLLEKKGPLDYLLDMGCLAQINLGSLKSGFSKRRKLYRCFSEGKVHFIGSDCHNATTRPPDYSYMAILRKRFGDAFVDEFQERAEALLKTKKRAPLAPQSERRS
jgi:protein-tyrosine phosphatase